MYRRQINEDEKKERKINTKKHKQNITTNNLFRESGSPLPPPPILFSTKIRNPAGPGRIQCLVCLFVRSFVCLFVQDCDQQLIQKNNRLRNGCPQCPPLLFLFPDEEKKHRTLLSNTTMEPKKRKGRKIIIACYYDTLLLCYDTIYLVSAVIQFH